MATRDDLVELKRILPMVSSPYVVSLIKGEITKLEDQFKQSEQPVNQPAPVESKSQQRRFTSIDKYIFTDEQKYANIKIRDIQGLADSKIEFLPEVRQATICIIREGSNLPNLKLTLNNLCKIVPDESTYTVSGDSISIKLKKKKEKSWYKLHKQKLGSSKKDKDQKKDPNASLMDMMRDMYNNGDDEMKKTISKAFYESQHKKSEDLP